MNIDMTRRSLRDTFERAFVIAGLVSFSGAVLSLVISRGEFNASPEGEPLIRSIFYSIYFVVVGLILLHRQRFPSVALAHPLILSVVGIALFSATWSVDPSITLRRSAALAASTAFAFYLVSRFTLRQLLSLFTIALNLTLWLSLLFVLLAPDLGIMGNPFPGAWQGAFIHKNELGRMMTFAAAFNLISLFDHAGLRWAYIMHFVFAVLLVIMSQSAGAFVQLLVLPVPLVVVRILRLGTHVSIALGSLLLAAGLMLGTILYVEYPAILAAMAKDDTLSGRTYLWQAIWLAIEDRFWLGYGYGAFWVGLSGPGSEVRALAGWEMMHSHNGWLEIWLNLGALGVIITAYLFTRSMIAALQHVADRRPLETYMQFTLLSVLFFSNLIETALMRQNSITWILFVIAVCLAQDHRYSTLIPKPRGARLI